MMASQKYLGSLVFASALLLANVALAKNPLDFGGKHNNKAPIEINADSLEVLQEKSMAVFSGHVVAIQGDVRLKAEKMTVHYKPSDENPTTAKKAEKSAKSDDKQGAIQKIETDGGVFLSTPQETASGENGVYDVEHQVIHLNNKVVLTRGQNVLKGDKLTYNFATGKSVITGGGATQPNGKKGERVRALFIPGSEPKPKD